MRISKCETVWRLGISIIVLLGLSACRQTSALKPMSFGMAEAANEQCPSVLPHSSSESAEQQCALYQVPLNWQEQSSQNIDVFLRVFPKNEANLASGPATEQTLSSKGQVWVLDGGPGASGATFAAPSFVSLIHEMGYDLYIPSHRGVGFSTHLDCGINHQPLDKWYVDICAETLVKRYGDDLSWFSSAGAAYDLDYLIAANNPDKLPVVIMGTSYGSFVTQRYLQLFEHNIDAAILISGTNLTPRFENVSQHQQDTFERLLRLCDQQTDCAAMFSNSALDEAKRLILEQGWLGCEVSKSQASFTPWMLGSLASTATLRNKLAITIKQLSRCGQGDIVHLRQTIEDIQEIQARQLQQRFQFNPLVLHHQIFTELLSPQDQITDNVELPENPLLLSPVSQYLALKDDWPSRSSPIKLPEQLSTDVPILVLHGGLDMQAHLTWFNSLSSQLSKRNQHSVLFPYAGHGTPNYTQVGEQKNCSWTIVESFLNKYGTNASNSPNGLPLDTKCVSDVPVFTFLVE